MNLFGMKVFETPNEPEDVRTAILACDGKTFYAGSRQKIELAFEDFELKEISDFEHELILQTTGADSHGVFPNIFDIMEQTNEQD